MRDATRFGPNARVAVLCRSAPRRAAIPSLHPGQAQRRTSVQKSAPLRCTAYARRAIQHLPRRRAVPRRRQGDRDVCSSDSASRSSSRSSRPAAARCTRTAATSSRSWSAGTWTCSRGTTRSSSRRARAPAHPPPARDGRSRRRRRCARDPGRSSSATRTYELSEFLIDVLSTDDVGAYFPHRVTYHPTCHSSTGARCRRPPAPPAEERARDRSGRASAPGGVLRVRRHVLDQEPRRVGRDARRQDGVGDRDRRRGAVRRRSLVPDAHRRRP